ncbi:MAG: hypothetical protein EPO32_11300 [Anaerolineae bacterium]|nr:MAG: hypothetical protein EPO32_11300 [Anaerolineae bacterium]
MTEKAPESGTQDRPTLKDLWSIFWLALGGIGFWLAGRLVQDISIRMMDDPVLGCNSPGCAPGLVGFAALFLYVTGIGLAGLAVLGIIGFIVAILNRPTAIAMMALGVLGIVAGIAGGLAGFSWGSRIIGVLLAVSLLLVVLGWFAIMNHTPNNQAR